MLGRQRVEGWHQAYERAALKSGLQCTTSPRILGRLPGRIVTLPPMDWSTDHCYIGVFLDIIFDIKIAAEIDIG